SARIGVLSKPSRKVSAGGSLLRLMRRLYKFVKSAFAQICNRQDELDAHIVASRRLHDLVRSGEQFECGRRVQVAPGPLAGHVRIARVGFIGPPLSLRPLTRATNRSRFDHLYTKAWQHVAGYQLN